MKHTILKPLLTPFLLLILLPVNAQQEMIPKKCYLLLQGKIGRDISVVMNLVKINDTLLGTCCYKVNGESDATGFVTPGTICWIHGKMTGSGSFSLKDNYPWEKGNLYTGSFKTAQVLSGTFEPEKGKQKLPFEMKEYYPSGSIGMSVYYRKAVTPLVKKPKAPKAVIEQVLLVPAESSDPVISDTLKRVVLSDFSGMPVISPDPDRLLDGMMQVYFENYITSNESIYDATQGASFSWESLRSMKILFNADHILSFTIIHYAYTGGAHGIDSRENFVVDLKSGKTVRLMDLFADGSEGKLTRMLTDKLKKKAGIALSGKLTDGGYFADEISPSENFYIIPEGIGFVYNPYDIGPYSFGQTEIFLPASELKPVLRPGSLFERFTK